MSKIIIVSRKKEEEEEEDDVQILPFQVLRLAGASCSARAVVRIVQSGDEVRLRNLAIRWKWVVSIRVFHLSSF